MNHITSPDNPLIKLVTTLHTKKGRTQHNLFIAEGIRTCSTFLQNRYQPVHIFVTEEIAAQNLDFLPPHAITTVSQKIIAKISASTTPSGIVCVLCIPQTPSFDLLHEGIVLAGIQDPGNMGTLIRTCAAFDKKTVVIVEGTDVWSPKVIQASAGTIALTTIFQITWNELLAHKKNNRLIALVVKDGSAPQTLEFNNALLVIGSEAHGISPQQLQTCDALMTIPMPGNTESLNAACAGAIAMYAAWHRQN